MTLEEMAKRLLEVAQRAEAAERRAEKAEAEVNQLHMQLAAADPMPEYVTKKQLLRWLKEAEYMQLWHAIQRQR